LHWRRGQPIGLSGDEFTPPDRRAELPRGGQFALRISAFPFFSPPLPPRPLAFRAFLSVFSFSSSCFPVLRFPLVSVRPSVRPSVSPLAATFAFLSRGVSEGAAALLRRLRASGRSNKGERVETQGGGIAGKIYFPI